MAKNRWFRLDDWTLPDYMKLPEDAEIVGDLRDAVFHYVKPHLPPEATKLVLNVYANEAAYRRGERLGLNVKLGDIGEDSGVPFLVVVHRIWFQLVSGSPDGAAFASAVSDSVLAPEGSPLCDVLGTIFRKSGGTLDGLSPSQLEAFESRDAETPLERDAAVGASGRAKDAPLIVVVRQSEERERVWRLAIDRKYASAVQKYKKVADLLKNSPEVTTMERVIAGVAASGADRFIVLESSSGMGKTQMAFNLEASGVYDVFYTLCTQPEDVEQSVYKAFDERTMAFLDCVEKDAKVLQSGSVADFVEHDRLYLYAFIAAALGGEDSCRGQGTRDQVERELRRHKKLEAKPFVFFLDEIPRLESSYTGPRRELEEKKVRIMRNFCRSFGIPVILSSTNGTARTVRSVAGQHSRETPGFSEMTPWCVMVPSLPAVVDKRDHFEGIEGSANEKIPDPLEWILQHSRPLFANEARRFLVEMKDYGDTAAAWLECLRALVVYLAPQIRGIKEGRSPYEFELGQVGLALGCSVDATDASVNLVDSHYSCLDEAEPFDVEVDCTACPCKDKVKWQPRCKFPGVESDMLLHLALTGDHDVGGGKILRPLNAPLHSLLQDHFFRGADLSRSAVQAVNDGVALGNLVTGAVILASRRDNFSGVKFPAFLGRLLYEMGVVDDIDAVVELPSNHAKNATTIPFLSPPNNDWPKAVLEGWKDSGAQFANMHRVKTRSTDGNCSRFASNDVEGRCILSGEWLDHRGALELGEIERVLMNVPDCTSIHLVVAEKLYSSYVSSVSTLGSTATGESTSTDVSAASELLVSAKLQGADFYRISRDGVLSEFEELMQAKARVSDDSSGNGGGKVVVFVEIGDWYEPGKRKAEGTQHKAAKKQKLTNK